MKRTLPAFLFLAGCAAPPPVDPIQAPELLRHVEHLASDELEGRPANGPGGREAARYVAARFEQAGLEPLMGDDGFFQPPDDPSLSPNVLGLVRGTGEDVYLVTAHYDHLPPRNTPNEAEDRIFNGADDNASGTAALLVLAEAFAASEGLQASVLLVAFTAEEMGLRGSRYFVANPPLPLERVRGVINLDMIGRGEDDLIFCEGGPDAPELVAAVERANERVGLRIRFDEHPEWIPASDHYPFMRAGIPALYFGVEDHPDYHRVSDHADKVLPLLLERVTRLVFLAVRGLAGTAEDRERE